jgi:MFS family permease
MSRYLPTLPATFNRLAWSNLAAQSAEQIALAAAPIVAVLLLGVGEGQTGLLQTALTLPFVLFAIPAGLLADRLSRRWLMAGAEALRAAALLAILILIALDLLTLPLLALAGFIAVCGTVTYSVAAPALVPSLVAAKDLPAANARIELARTIAFAGGPAIGGFLVGWLGAAPAFAFAAALSVIAVMLLAGVYEPNRMRAPTRHPLRRSGKARSSCFTIPCCDRSSSRNSSSTPRGSCCLPYTCPTLCIGLASRHRGSARRWRCSASAW